MFSWADMPQSGPFQAPAKPEKTPGQPENFVLVRFNGFSGLNTKPTRPAIKDQQMSWCDNWMPLGVNNLRTMYDLNPFAFTIQTLTSGASGGGGGPPPPPPPYTPPATHFNDAVVHSLGLNIDPTTHISAFGVISLWTANPVLEGGSFIGIFGALDNFVSGFTLEFAAGQMVLGVYEPTGNAILTAVESTGTTGWRHDLISWNTTANTLQWYVNENLGSVSTTWTSTSAVDYSGATAWRLGFQNQSIDMSEVWVNVPNAFFDISLSANRLLFTDGSNGPVNLGTTGQTPTGLTPTFFFHGAGNPFATNRGTAGGFTLRNGILTPASSAP